MTSWITPALMPTLRISTAKAHPFDEKGRDGQGRVDRPRPLVPLRRRTRGRGGDRHQHGNRAGGNVRRFSSRVNLGSGSSGRTIGDGHFLDQRPVPRK